MMMLKLLARDIEEWINLILPYCITVDDQTLEDGTVTIRNRDTMEQGKTFCGRSKILRS